MQKEKLMLNVQELQEQFGISRSAAYQLTRSKNFPTIRVGNRVLIPVSLLNDWIKEQTINITTI